MAETLLFETKPSLRITYFTSAVFAILLLLARIATNFNPLINKVLLIFLAIVIIRMFYFLVKESSTRYSITSEYVGIKFGIVATTEKRAPWLKITNFTKEQSVVERLFGLAHIRIDTAGHEQWEIEFFRLPNEEASQIMDLLNEYVPDAKGPETSDNA